jgi:prolyl oligopeptidase
LLVRSRSLWRRVRFPFRVARAAVVALIASGLGAAAGTVTPNPPTPARVVPYSQTFYGTARSDPYHWMEAGGQRFDDYVREQSAYTASLLHANPGRPKLLAALRDAYASAGAATTTDGVVRAGSRVFYLQSLPGSSDPSVLARADGQRTSTVVVNAKTLPKGTVIGWFEPSPSGKQIAYGVTASSENVVIHVCNADGGGDIAQSIAAEVIPDVTWRDEYSFYYNRTYQSATSREEASFLHRIGAKTSKDVKIGGFGAHGPLGAGSYLSLYVTFVVLGKDAVVAATHRGASPYESVFVAPFASATTAQGPWRQIFGPSDAVVAAGVAGRSAYGLSDRGDARRTILVRDRSTGAPLRTIAPRDAGFRTGIFANRSGIYVTERRGAEMQVEHLDGAGKSLGTIMLPKSNIIVALLGDSAKDVFTVETATFRDPGRWYEVRGAHAAVREMGMSPPPPSVYSQVRYEDASATSADGTHIPYTVVYAAGTPRDGRRPAVVFGYGAYGIDALEPPTPPFAVALMHFGVVFVLTHIRGGGEFGEPWHLAGKGPTKQHTIDDYVACARAVVTAGWTSPAKIAGDAASAGGITIGGAITQHPDLFAVAISHAGVNDMVDYEHAPNGAGNVPEFGSVKTPNGFRDLLAMSAYDHVVPAPYPATILTTGLADVRVPPWEVAKMAARLQAATTSGKPVLLRADEQGHGLVHDAAAQLDEDADVYTFMLWQVGEPGFQPT